MMPPRRKKWTEEEERTLIGKYGEMLSVGTLAKMKTREKKFRPIAAQVNSMHHSRDPVTFPWQWSWKDASTKVQNMRHQYLLVKQKIKNPVAVVGEDGPAGDQEEFNWLEGLNHWPNFLRYKDVFGDVALGFNSSDSMTVTTSGNRENGRNFAGKGRGMDIVPYGHLGRSPDGGFGVGVDGGENGVLGLGMGFEYDGEEGDENNNDSNYLKEDGNDGFDYEEVDPASSESKKKRKRLKGLEKRARLFLVNQLAQLREREARLEEREAERERERQRREQFYAELVQERERKLEEREKERERVREMMRKEWFWEREAVEKESEESEAQRRERELIKEREWEEMMEQRRLDWKKRIDGMLSQHRAEMDQIQSRILHEQQALASQVLGIVSQWTSHPVGLSDHTGVGNHYLSQMIQNLHNVNGIVHGEDRVEGDNQDDQFIVDG